jgi:hypothetical protein
MIEQKNLRDHSLQMMFCSLCDKCLNGFEMIKLAQEAAVARSKGTYALL